MYCWPTDAVPGELRDEKRTQHSMVRFVGRSSVESGMDTYPFVPLNVKALPTIPTAEAVAPPSNAPFAAPAISFALPSPGHHPTNPGGAQPPGTVTVNVATAL